MQGADDPPAIMSFDLNDEAKAEKPVFAGSLQFTISADGKKLLVVQGKQFLIMDAGAGAKPTPVPTNGMTVVIDPREEWKQLFTDAWRIERDFFYDPHMHGVNWSAIRDQYAKMLDRLRIARGCRVRDLGDDLGDERGACVLSRR